MKKTDEFIIRVAGSGALRLAPGHYCGNSWGFNLRVENWLVDPRFHQVDGFSSGGVLDFADVERLYKAMQQYKKKNKRKSLSELFR